MFEKVIVKESQFLTALDIRAFPDDKRWLILSPLVYESKILQMRITVPAGYITDLASVPRVPVAYWFWGGRAHHESVPHDFMYALHPVSKRLVDDVFEEAMIARGKSWFVRKPMLWGVRIGGGSSYRNGPEKFKKENPGLSVQYLEYLK